MTNGIIPIPDVQAQAFAETAKAAAEAIKALHAASGAVWEILGDKHMRQLLKLHPDSRSIAVTQVEVDVARPRSDRLVLSYILIGNLRDVLMPPVTAPTRSDELWRHTCFEAFVRASVGADYYELNFAPSTQWAAYRFSSYRSGMSVAMEVGAPIIEVQSSTGRYTFQVTLEFDQLSGLPRLAGWHLGLSAVIEDSDHRISYWALAHPAGKPDFHHAECFVHELMPVMS